MDEFTRDVIEALRKAKARWDSQAYKPEGGEFFKWLMDSIEIGLAKKFTGEELTPVLAQHLAEHAIVTRATLRLLKQLDVERPDEAGHYIATCSDASGCILTGNLARCPRTGFGHERGHAIATDALRSLLKPEEKPTRTAILQDAKLIIGDGDARQTYKLVALELETTS